MSIKVKLFPAVRLLAAAALLCAACGAASGNAQQETPCQRDCALGFVSCLEDCDAEDGLCRDACMAERSACELDCERSAPPTAIDAGVPVP
jgi:hypothetical protein